MKCGLVLLAVLVSIFTILRPSVDCGIKWLSAKSSSNVNNKSEQRGPSRYAPEGSEVSQFVNNFNPRRSGSASLCCLAVLAHSVA